MKELNINRAMLRPAGPSVWGEIYGDIQDQKDLVNLVSQAGGVSPEDREKIDKIDNIEAGLSAKADRSELQSKYNELNNKIGDLTTITEEILGV